MEIQGRRALNKTGVHASLKGLTMMFRKFLFLFCAMLLFAGGVPLWAQNTSTNVIDFEILDPDADDARVRLTSPHYLAAGNKVGSLASAWSTNASLDSIDAYTDGEDYYWVASIESWSTTDSIATIRIDEYAAGNPKLRQTYRGRIDWSVKTAVHNEANIGSTPLGLNLTVCAASTIAPMSAATRSTWKWYLYFSKTVKALASTEGAQAQYSLPTLDSLTVLDFDTLAIGDTVYSKAVPGQFGYISLFLTDGATNNDSLFRAWFGYQTKLVGGNWSGPMDSTGLFAFPVIDSLVADSGATRSYWTSTTPADSTRFVFFNKNSLGRTIVKALKALWRD